MKHAIMIASALSFLYSLFYLYVDHFARPTAHGDMMALGIPLMFVCLPLSILCVLISLIWYRKPVTLSPSLSSFGLTIAIVLVEFAKEM